MNHARNTRKPAIRYYDPSDKPVPTIWVFSRERRLLKCGDPECDSKPARYVCFDCGVPRCDQHQAAHGCGGGT